jgi:hypothetical protein
MAACIISPLGELLKDKLKGNEEHPLNIQIQASKNSG